MGLHLRHPQAYFPQLKIAPFGLLLQISQENRTMRVAETTVTQIKRPQTLIYIQTIKQRLKVVTLVQIARLSSEREQSF